MWWFILDGLVCVCVLWVCYGCVIDGSVVATVSMIIRLVIVPDGCGVIVLFHWLDINNVCYIMLLSKESPS